MPPPKIKNVLDFADVHEVVGHGRARRPSGATSSQFEVEVVVAPVSPASGFRFVRSAAPELVWVGCGELAALPVGSRWRGGFKAGVRDTDVVTGRGTVVSVTATTFGEWAGVAGATFFPTSRLSATRCFDVRLKDGTHGLVMLPVTEAVRTVFGRTTDLLLQLYGGRVDEATGRFQIGPELLSVPLVDGRAKDGLLRLRFPRQPSKPEAMLAAMVLTDPILAESFYGLHDNLIRAASWKDGCGVVVDTKSPIMAGSLIEFEGRWIGRPGPDGTAERRLLVTHVLSLSMKPAFTTLDVHFPTSEIDPEAPYADARIRISDVDVVYVRSERDPAPGGANIEIDVPGCEIVLESGVDFRLLPDMPAQIRPQPGLMSDDDGEEAKGSAGDAVPRGDRKTRRVTTRDTGKVKGPDTRRQSMGRTDEAVVLMVESKGWKVAYRRGKPFEDVGGGFEVLVVGVVADKVQVMVCDGGTSSSNPRALGLVAKAEGGSFDHRDMAALRSFLCEGDAHFMSSGAKAAAAKVGLRIHGVIRPANLMAKVDAYSTVISRAIISLLGS